jgi:hypothetical protein
MLTDVVGHSTRRNMLQRVLSRILNSIDGYLKELATRLSYEVTARTPLWADLNTRMMVLLELASV